MERERQKERERQTEEDRKTARRIKTNRKKERKKRVVTLLDAHRKLENKIRRRKKQKKVVATQIKNDLESYSGILRLKRLHLKLFLIYNFKNVKSFQSS